MDLVALFVHLLILCLVLGLLYWIVTLVVSVLPPPIAQPARVILLILLALIALGVLLGEVGIYDTSWGWYGHHHRW